MTAVSSLGRSFCRRASTIAGRSNMPSCPDTMRNSILENTVVTREHLTPDLKLRLMTPDLKVWHLNPEDERGGGRDALGPALRHDPFWAIYWPGGQALARYHLFGVFVVHCIIFT